MGIGHYITLSIKTIFTDNMLLAYFLGCVRFWPVRNISRPRRLGHGHNVYFSCDRAFELDHPSLYPAKRGFGLGGFAGAGLKLFELYPFYRHDRGLDAGDRDGRGSFCPALYASVGIFLPLITANCAVLGATFFMDQRDYTFAESLVYGASAGAGWGLAIITLAALRKKMWYSNPPDPLKGLGCL